MTLNVYGKAKIASEKCPSCGYESFVIDGKFSCCGRQLGEKQPDRWKVHINIKNRARIPKHIRDQILALQDNRCLYCLHEFGTFVLREGETIQLHACWDHKCPFACSADNGWPNIAAACQVCNAIKSSNHLGDLNEIRSYIRKRRKELGYED